MMRQRDMAGAEAIGRPAQEPVAHLSRALFQVALAETLCMPDHQIDRGLGAQLAHERLVAVGLGAAQAMIEMCGGEPGSRSAPAAPAAREKAQPNPRRRTARSE